MTTQPEALRLANSTHLAYRVGWQREAAAELRRLSAENEALRERLSALLRNTAIALRGPEPELTRWSWHDLPELATALKAQRDALLEALKGITPSMPPADAPCHYGIVPQEKCGHCNRIALARAAIKAVEGEKT